MVPDAADARHPLAEVCLLHLLAHESAASREGDLT